MRRIGPGEWLGIAARGPAALLPVGMFFAASSTGSLSAAALTTSFALIGLALSVPLAGAAAERHGQRPVLLCTAGLHVTLLVLILAALPRLDPGPQQEPTVAVLLVVMLFALAAGLTAPAVGTMSRIRGWHVHRWLPEHGAPAASWMRREAGVDELLLVASPLAAGLLSGPLGPGAGLMIAALLGALAVPAYAMDPLAVEVDASGRRARSTSEADDLDEGPLEPLHMPMTGVEHGQQMVAQSRGLTPERPGHPAHPVGRSTTMSSTASVPSSADASSLPAALMVSLGVGLVAGGLWVSAAVFTDQAHRPGALGLLLALVAAAGLISSRWLPPRFSALDVPRRRRLFAVVLSLGGLALAAALAATVTLEAGFFGLIAAGVLFLGLGAALGVLLVEVYRVVAHRGPTDELVSTLSSVAGSLLVGMVAGLCAAALLAQGAGAPWSAAVVVLGALVPAAVALRPTSGPDARQGRASRTASL